MSLDKAPMYSAQLHSYALMLENPSDKEKIISPVKTLGLFCFSPNQVIDHKKGSNTFQMNARWAEVKRDDKGFVALDSYETGKNALYPGLQEHGRKRGNVLLYVQLQNH